MFALGALSNCHCLEIKELRTERMEDSFAFILKDLDGIITLSRTPGWWRYLQLAPLLQWPFVKNLQTGFLTSRSIFLTFSKLTGADTSAETRPAEERDSD